MHISALNFGKLFFETYCGEMNGVVVHDIGAQDVNGSLHDVCPPHLGYVGVDFVEGRGVSIVLDDPYHLPFADNSLDVIVCSSVFEHSQFFWLAFLEMLRVLKPEGLLYLNVPSNGSFHRYPVDCWRFYPDSGAALEAWAVREGYTTALLESFVGGRSPEGFASGGAWNDFVAVFVKDGAHAQRYEKRMLHTLPDCWNGLDATSGQQVNPGFLSPDHAEMADLQAASQRQRDEWAAQEAARHQDAETAQRSAAYSLQHDEVAELRAAARRHQDEVTAARELERLAAAARRDQEEATAQELERLAAAARRHQEEAISQELERRAAAAQRHQEEAAAWEVERRAAATREESVKKQLQSLEADLAQKSIDLERAFAEQELAAAELGGYRDRVAEAQRQVNEMLQTRSWRATAVARRFGTLARKVRNRGRSMLGSFASRASSPRVSAPQDRLALEQEAAAIAQAGVFDEAYYRSTYGDMRTAANPLLAYCESGWRQGRNPSPAFHTGYYLEKNPDIRAANINPLWHYAIAGAAEGRQPAPPATPRASDALRLAARNVRGRGRAMLKSVALASRSKAALQPVLPPVDRAVLEEQAAVIAQAGVFDEAYYRRTYGDMRMVTNPLLAYCESGWRLGRNPSAEFDTGFYLQTNPDIRAANINPLWHYVTSGAAEGRQPAPPWAPRPPAAWRLAARSVRGQGRALLKSAVSAVTERAGLNAEVVAIASKGLFDEAYYRATYADMRNVKRPLLAYCETGWRLGRNPSAKFDTQYYLETNPDIRAAGVNPLLHYAISGASEGRHALPRHLRRQPQALVEAECAAIRPTGFFDDDFYLAMYPDIQPVPTDPLWHYCEIGWLEGRNPSDRFDTDAYLAANTDIRAGGINPLWHYAVAGASEMRYPDPSAVMRYEDDIEFGRIESDVQFVAMYRSPDWSALFAAGSNAQGRALPDVRTGYYDSTDAEVLRRQARLAKRHGLHAFGFVVETSQAEHDSVRTLATWLAHPDIAFHFVVALAMSTRACTDELAALLAQALFDPRCLRVDGRAMLLVHAHAEADAARAVADLRQRLEALAGPIFLVQRAPASDALDHAPLSVDGMLQGPKALNNLARFSYAVLAARGIADLAASPADSTPRYPLISIGSDGDAAQARGVDYRRFHSGHYRRWLDAAIAHVRNHAPLDRRFVFADAWNDWRTGQVLEAERREGYGRLNETTRGLAGVHGNQPMPKVSVIVANYNHERFLRRRLDSIYAQTYRNFEVLLLDDCSSDDSRALMDSYAKAHPDITRTLYNEKNSGSAFRQWAKGIQAVNGDLVWIAESDDYCDERFLEVLVRCFDDEAVMLAGARCEFVNSDETPLPGEFTYYVSDLSCAAQWEGAYVETAHNEVRKALGIKNTIPNASGVVFRRPVDMPLLSQDWWLSMRVAGDWVFYLHLIRGGKIAYAPAAVNYFRRYQGSTAETTYRKRVFYEEVGIASRTVAELYDVPVEVLAQCRQGYHTFYGKMVGGNDADFDAWYDYDAILLAREQRKPNLLVSTMGFLPGGAEIFPIRLANEFKRQGLSVLLLNAGLHLREDGIRRMLRNDVPVAETSDLMATKALIESFGIEVLNSHQWFVQKYPALQPDVFDGLQAHVATLHGMIEHGDAFGVVADDLRSADAKVSVWAYTADKNLGPFVDAGLFETGSPRFVKVPNGIQKPLNIQPVPRAQMGIPDDAFVLCCVSRAIPDKGWQETVDAVALARELTSRDIHLVLVGNGPVYDAFRRLDMPAYVHLIGFSQDAAGYYAASDMGIMLTSFRSESFPLTIIDCLFVNRPFIATAVGEITNMLTEGDRVAGALIGLQDWQVPVEETARVIATFASDADRYRAAQAVVADVAERFSIEAVASRYVDLFEQCRAEQAEGE